MIKYFLFNLLTMLSPAIIAQVGINTIHPLDGAMHIDAKGNNPAGVLSPADYEDDVFISSAGYLGIGQVNPISHVHIKRNSLYNGIKIEDGSQSVGKILTSDASGNALWKYAGATDFVIGSLGAGYSEVISNMSTSSIVTLGLPLITFDNSYIDLKPGMWAVIVNIKLTLTNVPSTEDQIFWFRTSFSDAPNGLLSSDIIGSVFLTGIVRGTGSNSLSGTIIIRNSSTGVKRYYYGAGHVGKSSGLNPSGILSNFADNSPENYLLALRLSY
ncbi:hypothetical protein [Dysgonomonas sp. GY617]|uniref:hypothetical protein n=1 Tax=Dysgonomonas sp. GY617 TaxID=2780420 RepID=UPI0018838EDE|nr:hypothetical protein [Dysgonomonas sp. GY617]MBF0577125.1 hypothetical protein [Dysgonomonas sp. GY617]